MSLYIPDVQKKQEYNLTTQNVTHQEVNILKHANDYLLAHNAVCKRVLKIYPSNP